MAWTVRGPFGSPIDNQASSATTITLPQLNVVLAGDWIFLGCTWWTNAGTTISSVADDGPGLSWSTVVADAAGNQRSALIRAYSPAGFSSGVTVTVTFSGGAFQRSLSGLLCEVGGTASTVRNTATNTGAVGAHSVTVASCEVGDLILESNGVNGANSVNTADGNSTEIQEVSMSSGPACAVFSYRIAASTGSLAVGGTWASAPEWSSSGAAFVSIPDWPPAGAEDSDATILTSTTPRLR